MICPTELLWLMQFFVVGTHGVTSVLAGPLGYTGFIYMPIEKCSQHVMAQSILPFTASVLSLARRTAISLLVLFTY